MSSDDKRSLSSSVLVTLGLTGALTGAVSCGPCLNYAMPDTGDTGDTGDTAGEDRVPVGAQDARSRKAAADRVLARGVLPEDVARILAARPVEE
jgi:hypothetical protein